ncbi:hypothetical protein Hanom_Chr15g01343941 [Helianthus anomalus]
MVVCPSILELITIFIPVVCQKSLFQSISLKIVISVPVVFTFVTISVPVVSLSKLFQSIILLSTGTEMVTKWTEMVTKVKSHGLKSQFLN